MFSCLAWLGTELLVPVDHDRAGQSVKGKMQRLNALVMESPVAAMEAGFGGAATAAAAGANPRTRLNEKTMAKAVRRARDADIVGTPRSDEVSARRLLLASDPVHTEPYLIAQSSPPPV
jgi:hypothetical protein